MSLKEGIQGKTIVSNLPRLNSSNEKGDFTGYPDIPQRSLLRITFAFNPYRYQYLSPTSTPGSSLSKLRTVQSLSSVARWRRTKATLTEVPQYSGILAMAYLSPHRLPLGFDSKGKVLSPTWALNVSTDDDKCREG